MEDYIFYNDQVYKLNQQGYYGNMYKRVWIAHNGPIPKGMVIHHKDLDKLNNDIDNLQIMTKSEHQRLHRLLDCIIPPTRKGCKWTDKQKEAVRTSKYTEEEKRLRKNELNRIYMKSHRSSRANANITEEQRIKRNNQTKTCKLRKAVS